MWGWATRRVWACPPGSASALHTDLHASHHLLALLSGGAKEYVVFPADAVTRERLRYNDLGGRFEAAEGEEEAVWSAAEMSRLGVEGWHVLLQVR